MQSHIKLLLCISIILSIAPYGSPIKCWNCRSDTEPKCADPFDNTTVPITDCKHLPSICHKIRQKVNGQQVISRGCAEDYNSTCPSSNSGPNEVTSFCETCDYDGCNGAAAIGKTMALILAPLALLLFK